MTSATKSFYMGGEQEFAAPSYYKDVTNSGRSSLRLILESAKLRNKRVLLPDFFCQVIIDIMQEYQVECGFYHINENFSFSLPVNSENYDALYLIKFFGGVTDSFTEVCSSYRGCIIVDDVFSPYPHVLDRDDQWFSFNSLRKISKISDFSLLYSNFPLAAVEKNTLDWFSALKNQAKWLKYDFINFQKGDEQSYLDLFNQAEELLASKLSIFSPSAASVVESLRFFSGLSLEAKVRQENFTLITQMLPEQAVKIGSSFYSFAPLYLNKRDEIRSALMKNNIFLAIHWPSSIITKNNITESIISIPVDSRYNVDDLYKVCSLIKDMESIDV